MVERPHRFVRYRSAELKGKRKNGSRCSGSTLGNGRLGFYGTDWDPGVRLVGPVWWLALDAIQRNLRSNDVSIYVAVGVCALRAIPRPLEHTSFLWFLVWSSLLHGGVMLFQAIAHPAHSGHLAGDVWILAGGLGLAIPLRRAQQMEITPTSG